MATNYLDKTGLGTLWGKIRGLIPQPEDDENVLNLLAEFGYSTAVEDADGYVMTDVDDNIILG